MIRARIREELEKSLQQGAEQGLWGVAAAEGFTVETPKHANQGDYATNMALVIAGREKKKPRELAARLVELLGDGGGMFERVEIAGPGFVNFFLKNAVWQSVLAPVCGAGRDYGRSTVGGGRKVLVEFVSANPTGPLTLGHGRQAVLGDAIARLLAASGHQVTREYYYNDAGRQMRVLGESTRARYLEALGKPFAFPEDGYQGGYISEIAQQLVDEQGEALVAADWVPFKQKAERVIMDDINATLARMGIRFDSYYNEHSLYESGMVEDVIRELRDRNLVYEEDGAVWFRTTEFGMEKDRVIVKSSGEPTYRLPDIAYHREKFRRGYDWLVDIFGSDHIATVPDVMAGVRALGYDPAKVTVVIHQFVTLMREGKQVKMSTRKATYVTVDELIEMVGADVVRFFFLMRKADSQLEFDLDLATKESQENPVYYVQYANARINSIQKQAEARGVGRQPLAAADLSLLAEPEELALLKTIDSFTDMVEGAALALEPHRVIYFLMELAGQFHSYYNKHKVLTDDGALSQARLWLVEALRVVFRNGLESVGLSAPESM